MGRLCHMFGNFSQNAVISYLPQIASIEMLLEGLLLFVKKNSFKAISGNQMPFVVHCNTTIREQIWTGFASRHVILIEVLTYDYSSRLINKLIIE